ncbi:hypothetical protein GF377_03220 [candidate division GN15 bacterium]|nr:hypothetical protein [candidate division GN15 bacterium]
MTDRKEELKHRVMARKHELQEKLELVKAEAHGTANDETERLKSKLQQLDDIVKNGWDNLSESAAEKLNAWLK